jgi:hypothetical protein
MDQVIKKNKQEVKNATPPASPPSPAPAKIEEPHKV